MPGPIWSLTSLLLTAIDTHLAFSVTNTINIMDGNSSLVEGVNYQSDNPFPMVNGSISGLETFSRWCDVSMSKI